MKCKAYALSLMKTRYFKYTVVTKISFFFINSYLIFDIQSKNMLTLSNIKKIVYILLFLS